MNSIWWVVTLLALWFLFSDHKSGTSTQVKTTATLPTTSYSLPPIGFNGYPCTVDCSGHEAGYDWAEENEITDPDDCDGNSDSFIEGCQSYVEEQDIGLEQ